MDIYNGMIFTNKKGFKWRVVDCQRLKKILVESCEWHQYTTVVTKESIKRGAIFYPYGKMSDGCYAGKGAWISSSKNPHFHTWASLRTRTLDTNFKQRHKSYIDCSLCEEWMCMQNFCDWAESTKPKDTSVKWELDKDLLIEGNKLYSPETCCWLPKEINLFLSKMGEKAIYPKTLKDGSEVYVVFVREGKEKQVEKGSHYIGTYYSYEMAVDKWRWVKKQRLNSLIKQYEHLMSDVVIERLSALKIS